MSSESKKIRRSLPLKPLVKLKRDDLAKKWLAENHPWERTIFFRREVVFPRWRR